MTFKLISPDWLQPLWVLVCRIIIKIAARRLSEMITPVCSVNHIWSAVEGGPPEGVKTGACGTSGKAGESGFVQA